jgi:hypothetical protein
MLPVKLNKIFLKKINVIGYIFQKSAYISLEKRKSAYLPNQKTIDSDAAETLTRTACF